MTTGADSTLRFGEVDLTTCDREPIHTPGSIQPHGVMLVVDRHDLTVEQVAGNTLVLLGTEPRAVPGLSVTALLEADIVAYIRSQFGIAAPVVAAVTRLGVRSRLGSIPLDLTLHAVERTAILELEPAQRTMPAAVDPITHFKSLLASMQLQSSVDESCAAAAIALRAATGFDRAMVYRFLPDESGMVVAEDARAGLESFLGLHYPASDIPKQARELYRRNWLRTIADIDYRPTPLLPAVNPRTGRPVDMSHCVLRSVSPIHCEYLRNMGVSASLSASIVFQDRLWGMLVLHHYSPRLVSADLRIACEVFAQIFSLHIAAKTQAETTALRLTARSQREQLTTALAGALAGAPDFVAAIAAWDLPGYVGATGAVMYLDGAQHRFGDTPEPAEISALVDWCNTVRRPLHSTDHLAAEFARAGRYPAVASGLLAVGISREPRDYVMWFRPEIGRTVRWAGDPSASIKVGPLGSRLTPRGSFAEWLEVTRMQSLPWSEVNLEAAEALRVVLLECLLRSVDQARRQRDLEATRAMTEELELRVAQRTEQLRLLSADLEAVEERERRQIARDLHDDLGQTLAAARIRLAGLCSHRRPEVSSAANEVGVLIDRATAATRSLATQLAPAILHELGLSPALEWLGEEIERTFPMKVRVLDTGTQRPLSHEVRAILYRAVRELLINVSKHAHTDLAQVEAHWTHDRIVVRVSDNGVGYDPSAALDGQHRGLGLISVRERLSLIGGTMEVRSGAGAGTIAVLSAPIGASTDDARAPGQPP